MAELDPDAIMQEHARHCMPARWWRLQSWFRRCPDCRRRGWDPVSPRWEGDRVAVLLGVSMQGCRGCGR